MIAENLPPPSDLNIGNQTTRQDNTRGPNINPVDSKWRILLNKQ